MKKNDVIYKTILRVPGRLQKPQHLQLSADNLTSYRKKQLWEGNIKSLADENLIYEQIQKIFTLQ